MSDDLVKRLRAYARHPMMDNNCKADVFDVTAAADRIAALEAALAKADALALAVADNAWRTDYEKNTLAAYREARKLDA